MKIEEDPPEPWLEYLEKTQFTVIPREYADPVVVTFKKYDDTRTVSPIPLFPRPPQLGRKARRRYNAARRRELKMVQWCERKELRDFVFCFDEPTVESEAYGYFGLVGEEGQRQVQMTFTRCRLDFSTGQIFSEDGVEILKEDGKK